MEKKERSKRKIDDSSTTPRIVSSLLISFCKKREKYLEHEIILILTFFPFHSRIFFAFSFCISAYSNLPSSSCAQVNHEGFPDKRKMAQVLTREVDWELRNFYLDSINQCFRMMEYQVTTYVDKCFFAKRIIDCLAEIASLNCSDWDGERVMV